MNAAAVDAAWPDVSKTLDDDVLALVRADGPRSDATGDRSTRALAALRECGYLKAPVPEQFGGGGHDLLHLCAAQRALAMADPATAIAVNMHVFSMGMLVAHWTQRRDTSWLLLEAIATQGRLVASGFAEPGLGGSILRSTMRVGRSGADYRVTGRKSPCSLARDADLVCFQFQDRAADRLLVALVPTDQPGIRAEATWDSLGMRGSGSDSLVFDDCLVPKDLVFHDCVPGYDRDPVFTSSLVWFALTVAAVYLGVVRRALGLAADSMHRLTLGTEGPTRAQAPAYHEYLGSMLNRTTTLSMACVGVAQRFAEVTDPTTVLPAALGLKAEVARFAGRTVSGLCEMVGGSSYGRVSELSRLWRDAQAALFHPPSVQATRRAAAREFLGLPFTFDLVESQARP